MFVSINKASIVAVHFKQPSNLDRTRESLGLAQLFHLTASRFDLVSNISRLQRGNFGFKDGPSPILRPPFGNSELKSVHTFTFNKHLKKPWHSQGHVLIRVDTCVKYKHVHKS